ncbi:MAG: hypothetical protein M9935_04545 [Kiritimatiellae bacterium]|nr:hypothetical protein [Kiritimatiellia bacterium]
MKIKSVLLVSSCLIASAPFTRAQEPDLSALMGLLGAAANQSTSTVAVVDFRELKALLPDAFKSYKRTGASGEKNSMMGMSVSEAEGQYAAGDATLSVKIVDYSGTFLASMMGAWAAHEIDRESDTGYERTTTIGGHKALEKYDSSDKTGDLQILVAGRFMVEIGLRGGEAQDLQAAAAAIDLNKLAALKK